MECPECAHSFEVVPAGVTEASGDSKRNVVAESGLRSTAEMRQADGRKKIESPDLALAGRIIEEYKKGLQASAKSLSWLHFLLRYGVQNRMLQDAHLREAVSQCHLEFEINRRFEERLCVIGLEAVTELFPDVPDCCYRPETICEQEGSPMS